MLRRNSPSRNETATGRARVERMLGAPVTRSADGRSARAARGVYKPRRPQASPLFRLVSDHLHRLQTVYDERFAREYGPWRPVVAQVPGKFLAYGILDHGFARIRCDTCTHGYELAFSCKCRYFCPSCHAKRVAIWTQWLDITLLAPVPHRQVVPVLTAHEARARCGGHAAARLSVLARLAIARYTRPTPVEFPSVTS